MIEATPISTRSQFQAFATKWRPAPPPRLRERLDRLRALEAEAEAARADYGPGRDSQPSNRTRADEGPTASRSAAHGRSSGSGWSYKKALRLVCGGIAVAGLAALMTAGLDVGREAQGSNPSSTTASASAARGASAFSGPGSADSTSGPSIMLLSATSDVRAQSTLTAPASPARDAP